LSTTALFARALTGVNVKDLLTKVGSVSAAPAPAAAPAAKAEGKKEEKKKVVVEEESDKEDDDLGFGKFII